MKLFGKTKENKLIGWTNYSGQKYMVLFFVSTYPSDKIIPRRFFFDNIKEYEEIMGAVSNVSSYGIGLGLTLENDVYELNSIRKVRKKFTKRTVEQEIFAGYEFE